MSSLRLSSPVTVPFCRLPGSLSQTFDPATCLRSAFQVQFIADVAARPDFDFFVILTDVGGNVIIAPEFGSPFSLMWSTTDGQCWAAYVGAKRAISAARKVGKPSRRLPVDDPVYRSRMPAGWEPTPAVRADIPDRTTPGWRSPAFTVPSMPDRGPFTVAFERDELSANVHAGVLALHEGPTALPAVRVHPDIPLGEDGKACGRTVRAIVNVWFGDMRAQANPAAPKTVEGFARAAAELTNEQIFDLFDDGITQALRGEIYGLSDPSSPEPFRSAVYAMGVKFDIPRLTEF